MKEAAIIVHPNWIHNSSLHDLVKHAEECDRLLVHGFSKKGKSMIFLKRRSEVIQSLDELRKSLKKDK